MLGSGANGFVFGGTDVLLNRRVAVKIWPRRGNSRIADRTEQAISEARKIATVKSEFVVPVYYAGRLENGWIYMTMELFEGVPLRQVRDELHFTLRSMFWSSIARGLDDAEAVGAFHGDLHEGNVLVAGFRLAIVDFGTSALAGRPSSMQRHARMVHRFAKRLLPELNDYIPAPDIPSLVPPECATRAVGLWVSVAKELRTLDADLPSLTDVDLGRRLNSLGGYCLAPMINLSEPVAAWLASRDVSHQIIQGFLSAARVEMQRQELLPISKVWFGILSNRTVSGHGKLPSGGQELPR